ncbi:hypothetical protein Plhal304r1_c011g0042481 [Plasmopara halstedii]
MVYRPQVERGHREHNKIMVLDNSSTNPSSTGPNSTNVGAIAEDDYIGHNNDVPLLTSIA